MRPSRTRRVGKLPLVAIALWAVPGLTIGTSGADNPTTAAPSERLISLAECVRLALARNFDLRIAATGIASAQGHADQAEAPFIPTVSAGIQYESTQNPPNPLSTSTRGTLATETRGTSLSAGLSGQLPTGASYSASTAIGANTIAVPGAPDLVATTGSLTLLQLRQPLLQNRATDPARTTLAQRRDDIRIAEATAQEQALATVSAVEQAYDDWVAAREFVVVQQDTLAVAEQSLADTQQRIAIGAQTALDGKDAEALAASSRAATLAAQAAARQSEDALKILIADNFNEWRNVQLAPIDKLDTPQVVTDPAASTARAFEHRPEITAAQLVVDEARATARLQGNQRLPQLDAIVSAGDTAADPATGGALDQLGSARYPFYSAGVEWSIPWSGRATRGARTAADAQLRQSELQLAQLRQSIAGQIDAAAFTVQSTWDRITATRQAREFATDAVNAEQQKRAAGTSTDFAVLQLQRNLTSARSDEVRARADYAKAVSQLHRTEGTSLDTWQLTFDPATTTSASIPGSP